MPEIPEMEHYREMLGRTVLNRPVTGAEVGRARSINVLPEEFAAAVTGQVVQNVSRRAKYLVFHLNGGLYLVTHMMLDGRLYYSEAGAPENLPGTPHVTLIFADGSRLFFCGLGLGFLHLLTAAGVEDELAGLGIEPLSPEFTWENFTGRFKGRRGAVKPLLMDQKLVAGIGNAYSNETLFAAGILPGRPVPEISEGEMWDLWQAIPRVLQEGIRNGGYIEEPYAAWDTASGGQNARFMVYDRGGEPCRVCGTAIAEEKLNGRRAYYCNVCQK